jgi:hypothetical protein
MPTQCIDLRRVKEVIGFPQLGPQLLLGLVESEYHFEKRHSRIQSCVGYAGASPLPMFFGRRLEEPMLALFPTLRVNLA